MADAYTTGIRKALTQKGIANQDIGYNPQSGAVTVKGQDFLKGQKSYGGTNFTNQQSFNQAWQNYNQTQQQPPAQTKMKPTGVTGTTPAYMRPPNTGYQSSTFAGAKQAITGYQPQGATTQVTGYGQPASTQYNPYNQTTSQNPYTTQADAVIQQLLNYGQNQQNFDPYSSSGYRAAEAQANRQAQQGIRQAQESLGSAGFGRSTNLAERSQGIANNATEYLMTQVVPQLEAQEQQRRQQEYNNILSALSPLMNQQGRADELVQRDFTNNLATAEMTGNYMPQGANDVISQLMALKQQAEAPTITRDARAGLSAEANVLRGQLQAMGVDPELFGSGVSQSQAAQNVNRAGQQTLAAQGQNYEQQADLRNFNRDVLEADRDYERNLELDEVQQEQWTNEFNERVKQDGIKNALDWANQNLNEQQESRIASKQSSGGGSKSSKSSSKSSGAAPKVGDEEFDPNMPLTMSDMYKYIEGKLPSAMQTYGPSNKNDLIERMILSNPNLSDKDIFKLYQKFGIQVPEQ